MATQVFRANVPAAGKGPLLESLKGLFTEATGLLRLYQNNIAPAPGNDTSQFVEATFDGYVSKGPLTMTIGPLDTPDGGAEIQNTPEVWTMSGTTTPNVIYGWYYTVGGEWVAAGRFDVSVPMVGLTSGIVLPVVVRIPQQILNGDMEPIRR